MINIEEAFEKLETINEQIRDASIPLAQTATLFEDGMKLSSQIEEELNSLENRVEILTQAPENRDELPQFVSFSDEE